MPSTRRPHYTNGSSNCAVEGCDGPSTLASINAAKTHCKRGHEFDAENTIRSKSGARQCRECSNQLRRERQRAGAA